MRAITLYQPWGWLMLYGPKRIENRDWKPPPFIIGQRVLVHQGKKWNDEGASYIRSVLPEFAVEMPPLARAVGVLGSFRIDGYLDRLRGDKAPADQAVWYFGDYGWLTSEPEVLTQPVPWRGALGLWAAPAELEQLIEAAR